MMRKRYGIDVRFDGKRIRRVSPWNTRTGAKQYEKLIRQRLAVGEPVDNRDRKGELTFATYAEEWMNITVRPQARPSEVDRREWVLKRHLLPAFGSARLADITARDIKAYVARRLGDGRAAQTVCNEINVLSGCLRSACEDGELEHLPLIRRPRLIPALSTKPRFLSEPDCVRLLDVAKTAQERLMFLVALHTGMRVGEILGLPWDAVDFDKNIITVRQAFVHGRLGPTKNMKEREIGMTASLRAALLGLPTRTDFVFPNPKGTPYQQDTATKRIHAACARAGLPKFGWHVLRHTFASHLVIRDVPLIKIRDLLGHSSVKVTERYAHLLPSHSAHAVVALEALGMPVNAKTDP